MLRMSITAYFDRGYIADPYWPALARVIDIQKQSGMNRARSSANRRKALEEHLQHQGMTLAEYEELERQSKEPFYRGQDGEIIVPELHVISFLVATSDEIRSAILRAIEQQPPVPIWARWKIEPPRDFCGRNCKMIL